MNRSSVSIIMFAATLLSSSGVAQAAPPTYRLTEFGADDSASKATYVTGVNALGEIAVTVYDNGNGTSQAYLWRSGTLTSLSGISNLCGPNSNSSSAGINNFGHVGVSVYSSDFTCFKNYIWNQGKVTFVGPGPTGYTVESVSGPNDRDEVIGSLAGTNPDGSGFQVQYSWQNGKFTILPPLPNGNMYYPGGATATGLNDFGVIAGSSGTAGGFRGVIWVNSKAIDMGTCPGIPNSAAGMINNLGMVVGSCQVNGDTFVPFVWQAGTFTTLPIPNNGQPQSGSALGINDLGQIVGYQYPNSAGTGPATALLWERGAVYDVNTLIAPNDPLKPYAVLLAAEEVTLGGQIVAMGQDTRIPNNSSVFYVLTPEN